jgi:flagellar hook-associated protein 3 FlgL
MGINRFSNSLLNNQAIHYLNQNMGIVNALQEKLATGKNINRVEDDPIGLTRIFSLSNTIQNDQRFTRNIDEASAEINITDKVLGNMISLVQRTQELTTQASNFTNSQAGRDAIALEISQIIDQMVQLGNTDIGGKYVFGGFKTDQPPFVRNSTYDVSYNGTPPAEPWQRTVEVSDGITLTVNVNGQTLMGAGTVAPAGAPPYFPSVTTGSGLLQTMTELLYDLQSYDPALPSAQLPEIRNRLDDLTADMATINGAQSTMGSVANRLELTKSRISERNNLLTKEYASIQNVDMAKLIADLNYQENVFQGSLAITGRVLQTSLLNFLR